MSQLTGVVIDSVCKISYASVFDNIAHGLVTRLGCDFAVPEASPGQTVDPGKVVVQHTPASGPTQNQVHPLTRVTDISKCDQVADGWYYDDNAAPTKIVLCAGLCTAIGDSPGNLEVLAGCAAPPPR